jgi:hypothetical protein
VDNKNGNDLLRAGAGVGLVGLGAIFLLQEFFGTSLRFLSWSFLWPLFVVVPGLVLFAAMLHGGRSAAGLAIPGSIVTMTGLILLYQNTTSHWQSWAYAWVLIAPTSIGIGRAIQGWWTDRPHVIQDGRRLATAGVVLFLILAVFFELVLDISGLVDRSLGRFVFPLLLIAGGAFLVLRGGGRSAGGRRWS